MVCGRIYADVFCTGVLLSQPDQFPFKCEMLAMKSDRLMLLVVLMAVCVLITKVSYVIVRPLSAVGYTSVVANVIHSRHRSN